MRNLNRIKNWREETIGLAYIDTKEKNRLHENQMRNAIGRINNQAIRLWQFPYEKPVPIYRGRDSSVLFVPSYYYFFSRILSTTFIGPIKNRRENTYVALRETMHSSTYVAVFING